MTFSRLGYRIGFISILPIALALVALLTYSSPLLFATPGQNTILRCEPESIVAEIGESVSFTIFVEDVIDLNGADVRLSFDPSIAQVVDANGPKPGVQIEMLGDFLALDFVLRDAADNVAGTIWYANVQVNPTQPVSGSGALARVTMQSLKAGSFEVPFTFQELVIANGDPIPATVRNCNVAFFDPNAVNITYLPISIAPSDSSKK